MTISAIVCEVDYASYEKKPRILSIESWLFNDVILISWFMKQSPHKWVAFHLLKKNLNKQGPFFIAHTVDGKILYHLGCPKTS